MIAGPFDSEPKFQRLFKDVVDRHSEYTGVVPRFHPWKPLGSAAVWKTITLAKIKIVVKRHISSSKPVNPSPGIHGLPSCGVL